MARWCWWRSRGTVTRLRPDGGKEFIAELSGDGNGTAIGLDGNGNVCNNGGFHFGHEADARSAR